MRPTPCASPGETDPEDAGEEVVSAGASEAGVSAVTQRGAVIGLELIIDEEVAE